MPVYNKLVRDKIVEIIEAEKKTYHAKELSEGDYIHELKMKLYEEVHEVKLANNSDELVEELADLSEIIHALLQVHNISVEQL